MFCSFDYFTIYFTKNTSHPIKDSSLKPLFSTVILAILPEILYGVPSSKRASSTTTVFVFPDGKFTSTESPDFKSAEQSRSSKITLCVPCIVKLSTIFPSNFVILFRPLSSIHQGGYPFPNFFPPPYQSLVSYAFDLT